MNKPVYRWGKCLPVIIALSLLSGAAVAQSSDQIKNIPQQIKQNAETKAVVKSNTVANNATTKLDSASNKAFKGMTGLFKKKKPAKDSTVVRPIDSTVVPPKSSSRAGGKSAPIAVAYATRRRTC
jgi:hypothetical protein